MIEIGTETLDPFGESKSVGDVTVLAAGVSGSVTVYQPVESDTRAETLDSEPLAAALGGQDVDTDYIIEFAGIEEVDVGPGTRTRSTNSSHTGIEISIPAAGASYGQIVLVTDENGVATWHLPVTSDDKVDTNRAGSTVSFVIPAYAAPTSSDQGTRGILGYLGKKLVRALSFKLIDKVAGEVGEFFAQRWEKKKRPYAVRTFTPTNYSNADAEPIDGDAWAKLSEGPALLFVHGTFSRAFSAFQLLPSETMSELYDRYDGRVFAFDHMTLSADPTDNATWFVRNLPGEIDLTVDIVCHSRGGHVSRILSDAQSLLPMGSRKLRVRKLVFVASPNSGTVLADPDHMGDFVDAHTNILGALPDNAITDTLEIIIATLKQMAVGTLKGLKGLQSMNPDGEYMREVLNAGQPACSEYHAIAANFEPTSDNFGPWAKDRLMDKIFAEHNDLVVPTDGVSANLPIADGKLLELGERDGVHHGNFFQNPNAVSKLREWLTA